MGSIDNETREALLSMYDVPDAANKMAVIEGYDKDHAERTTRIVLRAAKAMGVNEAYLKDLEATALLHDIGRAGLRPELFGKIFSLAQENGLPVRIMDIRSRYPEVKDSEAAALFTNLISPVLEENGIELNGEISDHISMRMDYEGRTKAILAKLKPQLDGLGIEVKPWMEKVILYYYYPHYMKDESADVRMLGMLLVACENLEAYNNLKRGRDYYGRKQEYLRDAFRTIEGFRDKGLITDEVLAVLKKLAASSELDGIIRESRGMQQHEQLPEDDLLFKSELASSLE